MNLTGKQCFRQELVLCLGNMVKNISMCGGMICIRHSRAGGNPDVFELDSRPRLRWGQALRGSDYHFVAYLQDKTR